MIMTKFVKAIEGMDPRKRQFIFDAIFLMPFSLLLFELLLLSANCAGLEVNRGLIATETWRGYLCYGYPQFLQHSPYFDAIFLRAALVKGAEHWSSALALAVCPFLIFAITRNARFAFWSAIVSAMWHELWWLALGWLWNESIPNADLSQWANFGDSVYYSIVILVIVGFVCRRYRAAYINRSFVLMTAAYVGILVSWMVTDNFAITVSGALGQPVLTSHYWDPLTNFYEVFTWWYVEASFVAQAWIHRTECRRFEK